ncbi:GIY-YIG nuclease family protein [Streptomyces achromogenes]|uniref:GIY-YIG nuclease family protein n=1 Tax=Streptomyces achromogenes TaxID=67255 RepID=UPI0036A3D9F5
MNYDFDDPRRFGFTAEEMTVETVPIRDDVWRPGVGRSFADRFPPLPAARKASAQRRRPSAPYPTKRRPPTPTTYLIGMEGSSSVKIGYTSTNPRKRLAGLQTGQPMLLSLLWSCPGNYEADLHARFSSYHQRGEWFDLSPLGDSVEVVKAAVAEMEAESR